MSFFFYLSLLSRDVNVMGGNPPTKIIFPPLENLKKAVPSRFSREMSSPFFSAFVFRNLQEVCPIAPYVASWPDLPIALRSINSHHVAFFEPSSLTMSPRLLPPPKTSMNQTLCSP